MNSPYSAGEIFFECVDGTQKVRKKEEKRKEERREGRKKAKKEKARRDFVPLGNFLIIRNICTLYYRALYVGSRRVLSDLLDFNGVVRNEDRIIGT